MINRRSVAAIGFFCLLFLASCDLLQTRPPENPEADKTTLPPATTPDIAVSNFQTAVQQNDAQEYLRLFSDTALGGVKYTFRPAQSAGFINPTLFSGWSRDSERKWMDRVGTHMTTGTSPHLTLSWKWTSLQADSAQMEATYELSIPLQESALPKLFVGTMYLMLAPNRSSGLWSIYHWEDIETHKDSSWSMAKIYFSQ